MIDGFNTTNFYISPGRLIYRKKDGQVSDIAIKNIDEISPEENQEISFGWNKYQESLIADCIDVLKNPEIFEQITKNEFDKKIVGEEETRKVIFLCAMGCLVENCQLASYNLLVNDEAGAGKDYITSKTLEIIPDERYIHKTRISQTAFTYWHNAKYEPDWTWDGKVFYAEDISELVLNSDVFRVFCSNGSNATIVINQRAIEITIKGKPVIITTTATATPNPELTRRFAILNLDSSERQTIAIIKRHASYARDGIMPEYDPKYKIALAYLKRVKIKIPYADQMTQHFPSKNIIMRTNFPRFLDYIRASAAFHQYQREKDGNGFILATGQDYNIAKKCFLRLFSNKYMIPLTINQKRILAEFEAITSLKGSVTQLHQKFNFISQRALQTNLQNLTKYGILEVSLGRDSLNRDVEEYQLSRSYQPNQKLDLPSFESLNINTSISTQSIISSISSISSITRDMEDTEVMEAQNGSQNSFDSLKIMLLDRPLPIQEVLDKGFSQDTLDKALQKGLILEIPKGIMRLNNG